MHLILVAVWFSINVYSVVETCILSYLISMLLLLTLISYGITKRVRKTLFQAPTIQYLYGHAGPWDKLYV